MAYVAELDVVAFAAALAAGSGPGSWPFAAGRFGQQEDIKNPGALFVEEAVALPGGYACTYIVRLAVTSIYKHISIYIYIYISIFLSTSRVAFAPKKLQCYSP